MSTDHCPHCDESCRVGPDPEYHAATSAVGYIWFAGEGCPVCRNVALLRQMADKAEADAATWSKSAAEMDEHGHHAGAKADRDEARIQRRVMQALRIAADRIEAGR